MNDQPAMVQWRSGKRTHAVAERLEGRVISTLCWRYGRLGVEVRFVGGNAQDVDCKVCLQAMAKQHE